MQGLYIIQEHGTTVYTGPQIDYESNSEYIREMLKQALGMIEEPEGAKGSLIPDIDLDAEALNYLEECRNYYKLPELTKVIDYSKQVFESDIYDKELMVQIKKSNKAALKLVEQHRDLLDGTNSRYDLGYTNNIIRNFERMLTQQYTMISNMTIKYHETYIGSYYKTSYWRLVTILKELRSEHTITYEDKVGYARMYISRLLDLIEMTKRLHRNLIAQNELYYKDLDYITDGSKEHYNLKELTVNDMGILPGTELTSLALMRDLIDLQEKELAIRYSLRHMTI